MTGPEPRSATLIAAEPAAVLPWNSSAASRSRAGRGGGARSGQDRVAVTATISAQGDGFIPKVA